MVRRIPYRWMLAAALVIPGTARAQDSLEYAVKFVCGRVGAVLRTVPPLAPGSYYTTINLHNPNPDSLTFRVKFAQALQGKGGPISGFSSLFLRSDGALSVSCDAILRPLKSPAFAEGYTVFQARLPLDVTAVYTTAGANGYVTSEDVERIHPRVIVPASGARLGSIVFSRVPGYADAWIMRADGSALTQITNTPSMLENSPDWAPDGSKIAFQKTAAVGGNLDIWTMNPDGSGQVDLTNAAGADFWPAWSPDGAKIAFTRDSTGKFQIYVMNANGTSQTNVSKNGFKDFQPDWSPDGTKIVFASMRDSTNPSKSQIYVMPAMGGPATRLTHNAFSDQEPKWCGSKIVFQSTRDGNFEIYVMNQDGTGQTNISNNPPTVPGTGSDDWPHWSPDCSKVVFASHRVTDNSEIYVMNPDGSGVTQLTHDATRFSSEPAWGTYTIP
jgi:Tol biopolymer transport system component